ncbi:hypothetical protein AB0A73_21520 [Glycomyces sp. NPDC047369]
MRGSQLEMGPRALADQVDLPADPGAAVRCHAQDLERLRGARPREHVSFLLALAVLVGALMPWRRPPRPPSSRTDENESPHGPTNTGRWWGAGGLNACCIGVAAA